MLFLLQVSYLNLVLDNGNLFAKEFKNEKDNEVTLRESTPYIIGPGDGIYISFYGLEELTKDPKNTYIVAADGAIFLPKLGKLKVEGLSTSQLHKILTKEYSEYLNFPEGEVAVIKFRKINVYIEGEIRIPGKYNFAQGERPTVYELIQKSGGITKNSNLEKITINRLSTNNTSIEFEVNLLDNIYNKKSTNELRIFDGDTITINRSNIPMYDQYISFSRTNLSPDQISVYMTGHVRKPGKITIPIGSTIKDAINISGGNKQFTGKLTLKRLRNDGQFENLKLSKMSQRERNNFPLQQGDLVHLYPNIIGSSTETLGGLTAPFLSIFTILRLSDN